MVLAVSDGFTSVLVWMGSVDGCIISLLRFRSLALAGWAFFSADTLLLIMKICRF